MVIIDSLLLKIFKKKDILYKCLLVLMFFFSSTVKQIRLSSLSDDVYKPNSINWQIVN